MYRATNTIRSSGAKRIAYAHTNFHNWHELISHAEHETSIHHNQFSVWCIFRNETCNSVYSNSAFALQNSHITQDRCGTTKCVDCWTSWYSTHSELVPFEEFSRISVLIFPRKCYNRIRRESSRQSKYARRTNWLWQKIPVVPMHMNQSWRRWITR